MPSDSVLIKHLSSKVRLDFIMAFTGCTFCDVQIGTTQDLVGGSVLEMPLVIGHPHR